MRESTEELLAKLEQATTSDGDAPLDEETAALRESWVALGELLTAANDQPMPKIVRSEKIGRPGMSIRMLGALAASLLVAFAAWTLLNRERSSIDSSAEVTSPNVPSIKTPSLDNIASGPNVLDTETDQDEFAWDDSFDEQLAATSQAIRSVQADWSGGDRRYSVLIDEFERFDDELSEGSL